MANKQGKNSKKTPFNKIEELIEAGNYYQAKKLTIEAFSENQDKKTSTKLKDQIKKMSFGAENLYVGLGTILLVLIVYMSLK
ncbi:MAG: hypothetical protein ABIA04_06890 [Pseudomonadota bacterium]